MVRIFSQSLPTVSGVPERSTVARSFARFALRCTQLSQSDIPEYMHQHVGKREHFLIAAGTITKLAGQALTCVATLCFGAAYGYNEWLNTSHNRREELSPEFTTHCAYAACAGLVVITAGAFLKKLGMYRYAQSPQVQAALAEVQNIESRAATFQDIEDRQETLRLQIKRREEQVATLNEQIATRNGQIATLSRQMAADGAAMDELGRREQMFLGNGA